MIWPFDSKVTANLVKSLWIYLVWLRRNLFINYWPYTTLLILDHRHFCKTFLQCIMWGCKVRPSIVIWLHDDNIRHVTAFGSHYRVCLQGLVLEVNVHLCSSTPGSSTLSPNCWSLFLITVILLEVLLCGKCKMQSWLIDS